MGEEKPHDHITVRWFDETSFCFDVDTSKISEEDEERYAKALASAQKREGCDGR